MQVFSNLTSCRNSKTGVPLGTGLSPSEVYHCALLLLLFGDVQVFSVLLFDFLFSLCALLFLMVDDGVIDKLFVGDSKLFEWFVPCVDLLQKGEKVRGFFSNTKKETGYLK